MAIQPIDLQIMYSQMSNVAKIAAHQQNGVQMAEALQQNKVIQQNIEQVASVRKAADESAKSVEVNPDGKKNNENRNERGRKKTPPPESAPVKEKEFRESYLGQHIDITR